MIDNAQMNEAIARLIHIEQKVDLLREEGGGGDGDGFQGHADQYFGHLTYAQHGEDLLFVNLFSLLGMATPSYLDVGAHHPVNISNTALLYARGSRGINVEANPDLMEAFRRLRPDDVNLNIGVAPQAGRLEFFRIDNWSGRNTFRRETAEAFVAEHPRFRIDSVIDVDVVTLADVVDRYAGGRFPDLLTLDIEGLDYDVLSAHDFARSSPSVLCVETVSGGGADVTESMVAMLRRKGFELYVRTVGNGVFLRRDQYERLAR